MEIIDFHVHPYTTYDQNFNMYKEEFSLTWPEAVQDLRDDGITHICGSVISREPFSGWDYLKALNDEALKIASESNGFYTPGFHIHPCYVKESLEEIERMHALGINLVGELVPYMHDWQDHRYDSKALQEILDLAGQYKMVVSYHTMNDWQTEMETMVKNNPDVTFVAAHPGQKADCVNHVERMQKYENLYLDISGTGLFRYGILKYLSARVGLDRVLFGTDYPMTPPSMYIEAVKAEHITDEDRQLIFCKNAKRILGIK